MTSNQLTYWRTEEEKRANRAKESENVRHNTAMEKETVRHDIEDEAIKAMANSLTEMGLNQKETQMMLDLWDMYARYGYVDATQLPDNTRRQILDKLGLDQSSSSAWSIDTDTSREAGSAIAGFMNEFKKALGSAGNLLKGIGSLF